MAGTPGIPQQLIVQTANLQNLVSWNLVAGATSYTIQRSLDDVNYTLLTTVSGVPLATSYIDSAVTSGVQYFYKVAAQSVAALQAQGAILFTGQPNPGDSASIANTVFTAVVTGATGNQFNIGGTTQATIVNLASVINSSLATTVTATTSTNTLTLTAFQPGLEGNGLQLSSGLTNTTITPFSNGANGVLSPFTNPQSITPAPTGEQSLGALRLAAQQRADRVNSQFVTTAEWNLYIKQAMFELYDLVTTIYEDYFLATPIQFTSDGVTFQYPLPNGVLTYQSGISPNNTIVGQPFYKIMGVDLGLQTANNAYVTINKFNFIDRNRFVYPNTSSTIYGVFNLQYRVMGNNIQFIPTPSAGQVIRIWYIPRMKELLADTDTTDFGISGWQEYVIVRAAKYALDKEESDTTKLTEEIVFLKQRIEESAANRDAGQPDRISDTRSGNGNGWGTGGFGSGYNGGTGGW